MHQDNISKIIISAQMGCSSSSFVTKPFFWGLKEVINEYVLGPYFRTLNMLSIILRVAGDIWDFEGGEGPERLEYSEKEGYITIDLVIPIHRWRDVGHDAIRAYVADQVEQCFELLVQKAKALNELSDEVALRADFSKAMAAFRERVWD